MELFIKTVLLTLLIAMLTTTGSSGFTGKTKADIPIEATLEPELPMIKGIPIRLFLSYEVNPMASCSIGEMDSYSIFFINPRDYGDTISRTDYHATHDKALSRSTTFNVVFPENDTCWLHLAISSGTCHMEYNYCFIATGNQYEYRPDVLLPLPSDKYKSKGQSNTNIHPDPVRDTLTKEHLQAEYEVIIDLRDSSHFEIAHGILRSIPDSCIYDKRRGLYKITTTLENLIEFGDHDFEVEFTTPPPWDPKYKEPANGTPEIQPTPDPEDSQGNLPPPPQISSINA